MDLDTKERFIGLWKKYFKGAALPVVFYYTDREGVAELVKPVSGHRCVIAELSTVWKGKPICFNIESIGCGGGKRYLGFTEEIMPNFEYFLSYGIPGKLEGERYKKTPALVRKAMKNLAKFRAPARFIVFKRWDALQEFEDPDVVIFFAEADVLSGLFTLTNFDEAESNGVFAPFAAGCASIVQYPYLERDAKRPRGVLGLFDVSARPCVSEDILAFSLPMKRFSQMIDNMEESFLITPSWRKVSKRLKKISEIPSHSA